MGIQIYINKEALERVGVAVKYHTETHNGGSPAEEWSEPCAVLDGLDKVMGHIDNAVYHDANHWGSSRKHILEFIEKHKLQAGQDWYEA